MHQQYPDKAKHNKFYPANGPDLRPAKVEEVLRYRDGSHRKKGKTDQQGEEIKKYARTKTNEKKKKIEAQNVAKKQEEVTKKGEIEAAEMNRLNRRERQEKE